MQGHSYIEDQLIVESHKELIASIIKEKKELETLRENASAACMHYIQAVDSFGEKSPQALAAKANNDRLTELAENKAKRITALMAQPTTTLSSAMIRDRLKLVRATTPVVEFKERAPYRTFTSEEMKKINVRYETLPADLRVLMGIATEDGVLLELIKDPVFALRVGHVYEKSILNFAGKDTATCPLTRAIFNKRDIIPCNSLIKAMESLLNIIDKEEKATPVSAVPVITSAMYGKLSTLAPSLDQPVSPELINLIKNHLHLLPTKHQMLFKDLCCDSYTGEIMSNPVLLPDGYIYDKKTALGFLEYRDGICPKNPAIRFNAEDITKCYFVINIMQHLGENILSMAGRKPPVPTTTSSPAPTHTISR